MNRTMAIDSYRETHGQIAAKLRELAAEPDWRVSVRRLDAHETTDLYERVGEEAEQGAALDMVARMVLDWVLGREGATEGRIAQWWSEHLNELALSHEFEG